MAHNESPRVTCSTCSGDGVTSYLIQSSRYTDSPDYAEQECEDCHGTGSESCEWCGSPADPGCSDMSADYTGPGATVCSWTCKALMLDGFAAVAKAVDEQRRILSIGQKHDADEFTKLLISVASGGRVQP